MSTIVQSVLRPWPALGPAPPAAALHFHSARSRLQDVVPYYSHTDITFVIAMCKC